MFQKFMIPSGIIILCSMNIILSLNVEIVDLSWSFNNETVFWPGVRPFSFTKKYGGEDYGFWYAANEFCAGEHGGTHFDAPYHFYKEGWKVHEVPINHLVGKGAVIDIREESSKFGRDARLKVEHLTNWETVHGPFEDGSILLVDFGRAQYWGKNNSKYMELEASERKTYSPGISDEAARWIADSGKFYGVGLDTLSVDPGDTTTSMVHKIFAKHQMYNLENVNLSVKLPAKNFTIIVAPMKIEDGTGAPTRILALIHK